MAAKPDDSVHPRTRAAWRRWLERHHARDRGVWLVSFKTHTGKPRIGYDATVEEALCFGWIDSTQRTVDDERTMQWFAPRKARSGWSRINKERVARLIADGRMAAPGRARIAAAQRDGSWTQHDAVEALEVPADLAAALAAHAPAAAHFAAFPRSVKRAILGWIASAKRDETRARRVATTAELAARNERANQPTPPPRVAPSAGRLRRS